MKTLILINGRLKTALLFLIAYSLLFSGCAALKTKEPEKPFRLTIIHMNDTHSHLEPTETALKFGGTTTYSELGGFTRIAAKIKEIRKSRPDSILVHAGDAVQGSYYFTKYNGRPEFELLSLLKIDAMEPGNHEFDRGPDFISDISKYVNFPIISSNIDTSGEEKLKKIIRPYIIKEIEGEKIGIFGLITTETATNSNPGKVLKFEDAKKAAERTIRELEKAGVNKIIALTHLGYKEDIKLASEVNGIDVIVGGHSHSLLGDYSKNGLSSEGAYPTLISKKTGKKTFIVQSWEWGKVIGMLDVDFDKDGNPLSASGSPSLISGNSFRQKDKHGNKAEVPAETKASIIKSIEENQLVAIPGEDTEAAAILAPYKAGVEAMQKLVVAKVPESILHIRKPGKHSSGTILPGGSQVGPVVCESMLWKANSSNLKAQIALLNGGGIRIDIPEGDLTVAKVNELLPFQNKLILLELTGKEIKEAIETGLADADGSGGGFPCVAGMRLTADNNKPAWHRLIKAEIITPSGKFEPLSDTAKYRLITNSYLAGGGNGYDVLKNSKGYRYDTGFSDAEAFTDYAKQCGIIKCPHETGIIMTSF